MNISEVEAVGVSTVLKSWARTSWRF